MTTSSAAPSRTRVSPSRPGDLLRGWRERRRRSQLELSLAVGVSARHLSFVETGRSQASRELLLALAEHLEVPLRERNAVLLAAGYAPTCTESNLDSHELDAARAALDHLLTGHEPYPALAIDRRGDVALANRAVAPLLDGVEEAALLDPPINIYRLSLHPGGLAPRIGNLPDWSAHLVHRLERTAALTADPSLAELLVEIRGYPTVVHERRPPTAAAHDVLLPLHLDHADGDLFLYSTVTHFGAPHDVTLAELAVESFFPGDDATRRILQRRMPQPSPTT